MKIDLADSLSWLIDKYSTLNNSNIHLVEGNEDREVLRNAHYLLLYLNIHDAYLKRNITYIPYNELESILKTINSLVSIDKCIVNYNIFLSCFIERLIVIADMIIQRTQGEFQSDFLSKIRATLDPISNEVFKELVEIKDSKATQLIKEKLVKSFTTESQPRVFIDELADKLPNNHHICNSAKKYFIKYVIESEHKYSILSSRKQLLEFATHITLATDEKTLEAFLIHQDSPLTTLMYFHFLINEEKHDYHFLNVIHWLQCHVNDKKLFAHQCLHSYFQTYKMIYQLLVNYDKNEKLKSYLLRLIAKLPEVLFILAEPLEQDQLNSLLEDIDWPTASQFNSTASQFSSFYQMPNFLNIVALIKGEILPHESEFCKYIGHNILHNLPFLLPLFKIFGKQLSMMTFEFSSTSDAEQIFPLMIFLLRKYPKDISLAFSYLRIRFIKINQLSSPFHQRDFNVFYLKYYKQFTQLIELMGMDAIIAMTKLLGGTVLPLERMLQTVPIIETSFLKPLSEYFKKCLNSSYFDTMLNSLQALNCLIRMKVHSQENKSSSTVSLAEYYIKLTVDCTPKEFFYALRALLVKSFFKEIGSDLTEQQIVNIYKRLSGEHFVKLVSANQSMKDDVYRTIFSQLLFLDLTGGDINEFLYSIHQKNHFGRDLARHNQAIRAKLEKHGISSDRALNYTSKYEFIIYPDSISILSQDHQYIVLWRYLKQLQSHIPESPEVKERHKISGLVSTIEFLETTINKSNARLRDNHKAITKTLRAELASRLRNIEKICIARLKGRKKEEKLKQDGASPLSSVFYEFAEHVIQQIAAIKFSTNIKKGDIKGLSESKLRYFLVEQWPKEKVMTFFLGDEVGCCLATTNAQFSAMVQRRMDAAMLFHVAIDKMTGRPAALIWLYLAETVKGKIVLIANFFEVNYRYGQNPILRKDILNGLLQFTYQYLQENSHIEGFYMSQLGYGHNVGDLDNYPLTTLNLKDKVGGAYIPREEYKLENKLVYFEREDKTIEEFSVVSSSAKEETTKNYYLESLAKNKFHRFDPLILNKELNPKVKSVANLLQEAVAKLSATGKDIKQIKQSLMMEHQLELSPFYAKSLAKDPVFNHCVKTTLKHYHDMMSKKDKLLIESLKSTDCYNKLIGFICLCLLVGIYHSDNSFICKKTILIELMGLFLGVYQYNILNRKADCSLDIKNIIKASVKFFSYIIDQFCEEKDKVRRPEILHRQVSLD